MSNPPPPAFEQRLARLRLGALVAGLVALAACAAGAALDAPQFFRAYLAAYLFVLGICLGSFALVMLYHLTGGAWGYVIRRNLEAAMRTLPLLALMFVPIALGLHQLYPWADPAYFGEGEAVRHKQEYLNPPYFWARAAAFFALWGVFAYLLDAWSRRQDRAADPSLVDRFGRLSGGGLVVYGITVMFSSIDWLMSLEPSFRSTIFGPLFASGHFLSAFAFSLIVLAFSAERRAVGDILSPSVLNDLGNILFTFVIIWAYMVFFQFMLVWIANLPHEVIYFLPRTSGGWFWVAMALILFGFLVPFFSLLVREVKRDPANLARVAALALFMQLVFLYYEVMPAFPYASSLADHWMDFLTPVGLGGVWLAYFLWQLERRPPFVAHDANGEAAARLRRADLEEAAHEKEIDHE